MQLENFIQFIIRHNALIIEGTVGLIVLLVCFLAYRTYLSAKREELSPAVAGIPNLSQLEESLKKILEKTSGLPSASVVAAASGGGAEVAPLVEEIAELKKQLEVRQAEVEQLKAAGPAVDGAVGAGAVPAMSDEDRSKLDAQIKELQAKLTEYEIISEDIADLSHYKEENAKLQKELDALKAGGGVAAAPAAAPVAPTPAAPTPAAPAKPEPEIVGKSKVAEEVPAPTPEPTPEPVATDNATLEAMSELTPAPVAVAPATPTENALVDDDIMKEFAAAVQEQKTDEATPAPAAPAAAQSDLDAFNAAAEAAEKPKAQASAPAPATEAAIDLGTMDMDKMVAEAMGLDEVKGEAANALETETDANKLLEEANSMENVKPEDAQLMGQFEDFVKKGSS